MGTQLGYGSSSRRWWLIGAFVLGVLIGLILAWRVWPVRLINADPSDLRAEHQRDYILMIADSWTVTGDPNEARERLYELTDEDTQWKDVDALIAAIIAELEQEGNQAAALRLQRMRERVPLPIEGPAATSPAEKPTEEKTTPRWPLILVGLGLVIMVVALIVWLVSNAFRQREGRLAPASASVPTAPDARSGRAVSLNPIPGPGGLGIHVIERTKTEEPRWGEAPFLKEAQVEKATEKFLEEEEVEIDLEEEEWAEEEETPLAQRPPLEPEEGWHIETPSVEPAVLEEEDQVTEVELPPLSEEDLEPVEEKALVETAQQLGVFEVTYEFGDDDFYHAFTIESPRHEFLGQCGIVVSDVLGIEEAQLVDAFDLWLFETQGTRTVSKVLVSEYAYTNQDLSAKLARKGELVLVEEGLVITLETKSLRLTATVESFGYLEDQPEPASAFDHLQLRMVVERI